MSVERSKKAASPPWWANLLLVGILAVATLLRVSQLRVSPGWYADEGSDLAIAAHLLAGEQRYFAIGQSTLIAGRPPLFHLVLAGLMALFGQDILTLRLLTAAYGVLVTLALFVLGRRLWGDPVALLAAALYAIYPNAVLYNRFGFLYNQLTLLNLILFYTLWRFITGGGRGWLIGACLTAGLAVLTGVAALPTVGLIVVVLLFTRRSALWWAIPALACLPLLYGGWMAARAPAAFFYDLQFLFNRVGENGLYKILYTVWNYKQILVWDVWFPLGILGLTRLQPSQNRLYTLIFFWYHLLTTVAGIPALADLGYHYLIPLLPWAAIGVAALLVWAFPRLIAALENGYDRLYSRLPWAGKKGRWASLLRRQGRAWSVGLVAFWILISPLIVAAVQLGFNPGQAPPAMASVTVRDVESAAAAVAYVNRRAGPDDVVLAPPHIAWMIDAPVADYQQAVAFSGGETQNYPRQMDKSRFLFDCSVEQARYAVLWDGWREWAVSKMPDVAQVLTTVEQWPIVYRAGDWRVFARPR